MKTSIRVAIAMVAVLAAGSISAEPPAHDINAKRHPNLAEAQRLSRQAWEKINAAQAANEWDMGGHAKKAKELLDEVSNELKLAAEAANKH